MLKVTKFGGSSMADAGQYRKVKEILDSKARLELSAEAIAKIEKCRNYLDRKTETSEVPLYGITTGFGSLCNRNISPNELTTLQENLVKSHACSVGTELNPEIVRLMLLLKAHALSMGHSGVQVVTVQRVLDLYNNDILPIVYDRGSLGASGDLAPLAEMREVRCVPVTMPTPYRSPSL